MASDHPWLSVTLVLTLCHVLRVSVLDIIVWMVSHWHYLSSDDALVSGVSGNIQTYTHVVNLGIIILFMRLD